jgi:alcohol dehydrogenase class IV
MQKILSDIKEIPRVLTAHSAKKVLLVCDRAFEYLGVSGYIKNVTAPYVLFDSFTPNPLYEDIVKGVDVFRDNGCDFIVAVGGGSTLDTAKCIKLFCKMDPAKNYLKQEYIKNNVPILAVPTTAGTGSESTRFAAIYYNGEKQSVADNDILPSYVVLEPSVLKTLPLYQKKCTMLDALCQAIEAWWSINSTEESRNLSKQGVRLIISNMKDYLDNTDDGNKAMLTASNLSGQAINIAQTTAAHAMSYKLTSLYHLPHGHAVALCLPRLWRYMLENMEKCSDQRGPIYLWRIFLDISAALGATDIISAIRFFEELLGTLEISAPAEIREEDLALLASSINSVRLKNNPVPIDYENALKLYKKILCI